MKIEEQVLSREQMAHLVELGVDTSDASMYWSYENSCGDSYWVLLPYDNDYGYDKETIPAYTIGDLIEKLPKRIPHKRERFIDVDLCLCPHIGTEDDGTITETMWVVYQAFGFDGKRYWHTLPHESELDLPVKDRLYHALCYIAENYKELIK